MADLSIAHRAALAQLLGNVPDGTLTQLALLAAGMAGTRARDLEEMLDAERLDRVRRGRAFAPLIPLFRPRADGVASMTFPARVLGRVWKIASQGEADFLPILDDQEERSIGRATQVSARLCVAAAAAVRDQPDAVWPVAWSEAQVREKGLTDLACSFDLGLLAHRAMPSLKAWVGRPSEDQLAELRLLVRDAAAIAPDGTQRLLDILFANLADAALVLRLVSHSSSAAGREVFLAESELAVFVERLIGAVEDRVATIARWRPADVKDVVGPLQEILTWSAGVLTELDMTIEMRAGGVWGKQVRDARIRINEKLSRLLGSVEGAVDKALPTIRMQTSGRMTRRVPRLDVAVDDEAVQAATAALALLRAVRTTAGVFGCEQQRWSVLEALKESLSAYADAGLEAINAGDWPDETLALNMIGTAAGFLELIEATDAARTVRRRAVVAGTPPTFKPLNLPVRPFQAA